MDIKMLFRNSNLKLDKCVHCGVDQPSLPEVSNFETANTQAGAALQWSIYHCSNCGGAILAGSAKGSNVICKTYPELPDTQTSAHDEWNDSVAACS